MGEDRGRPTRLTYINTSCKELLCSGAMQRQSWGHLAAGLGDWEACDCQFRFLCMVPT